MFPLPAAPFLSFHIASMEKDRMTQTHSHCSDCTSLRKTLLGSRFPCVNTSISLKPKLWRFYLFVCFVFHFVPFLAGTGPKNSSDLIQVPQGIGNVTPDHWGIWHFHQLGPLCVCCCPDVWTQWPSVSVRQHKCSQYRLQTNNIVRLQVQFVFPLPPQQPFQQFQRGNVQMGWLRGAHFKIVFWNKTAVVR